MPCTPSVSWLTQDFNTQARQLLDRIAQVTPFIRYSRKLQADRAFR